MSRPLIISVIGEHEARPQIIKLAEQVGLELARRGVTVVCGGLGGVMEAVCRGAKSAGGTTIGILPGKDPSTANRHVDFPIVTGLSYARNVIVVSTGLAVIAIGGAYGTLSEIGHAISDGKPVIGLETWTLARGGVADQAIMPATNPVDAVEQAIAATQQTKCQNIANQV